MSFAVVLTISYSAAGTVAINEDSLQSGIIVVCVIVRLNESEGNISLRFKVATMINSINFYF